jgi:hypothetical protein
MQISWIKGSNYIIGNTWGSHGNFLRISSRAVDLTVSGWPNEWINITWQCFIKSDTRYLYDYRNPKEIPMWASRVSNYIVTSLDSTDNKHGVQRQVRRCRRRRNFIYYIEYFLFSETKLECSWDGHLAFTVSEIGED